MAKSTVPLVATSDSWTASQHNTYIRDNIEAIWVGTTAGDTDYYTSATAKSRLAIGTSYQIYRSTGSAPAWSDLSTITANVAMVASQAAGDVFYASSSTALSRLAIGALHTHLRSTGSAPEWSAVTYRRRGGSSTVWATSGVTTYTPTKELIQKGVESLTLTSGSGSTSVSFPTAYVSAPHVLLSLATTEGSQRLSAPLIKTLSNTGFTFEVWQLDSGSVNLSVHWQSSGE